MTELLKYLFKVKGNTYGLSLKLICAVTANACTKSTTVLSYYCLNILAFYDSAIAFMWKYVRLGYNKIYNLPVLFSPLFHRSYITFVC